MILRFLRFVGLGVTVTGLSMGGTYAQAAASNIDPESLALLSHLVEINTETTNLAGLERAREVLIPEFEALGMAVTRHKTDGAGHEVLSFEVPNAHPKLLMVGHLDTVFPVDSPFQRFEQHGQRLTGPGVIDMKGGLVLELNVLSKLRERGLLDKVRVVINDDEEVGSIHSKDTLRQLAADIPYGLVFEPGLEDGAVVDSQAGVRWIRLDVKGKASHAGLEPEKGIDACLDLALKLQHIAALAQPADGLTINPGVIQGGTKPNVVCDHASVTLDVRFRTLEQWQSVDAGIKEIASKSDVYNALLHQGTQTEYTQLAEMDLLPLAQTTELSRRLKDAAQALGQNVAARAVGYGSDGNNLAITGMQLLVGLGPYGGGMHSDREFMNSQSFSDRLALVTLFVSQLLSNKG